MLYHNSHLYKNWNIISKFFLWILSCFKLLSTIWIMLEPINTYFFLIFSTTELCFIIMILTLSHQGKKLDYFSILILSATTQFFYEFIIGLIFKKRFIHNEFQGRGMGVIKLLLMMKYVSITWYYFWFFFYIYFFCIHFNSCTANQFLK